MFTPDYPDYVYPCASVKIRGSKQGAITSILYFLNYRRILHLIGIW